MANQYSLTSTREVMAFAVSHLLGWIFASAVYPLVYAYLNGLGTRLLAVNEIRVVAVVLAVLMTFIVMGMFLFFRRLFAGAVETRTTTGREIVAYLATHAVGMILIFNIAPLLYQALYRVSLSRYFVLASAIMNVITFSIVFVLFILLRRAWMTPRADEA
jgi:hypothetical protein